MSIGVPFTGDLGLAIGQRERERRARAVASGVLDPFQAAQATYHGTPGWDAFWGGLADTEEAANAAGMRTRFSLGDFGNAISEVETDGNFQKERYMPRTRARSLSGTGDFDPDGPSFFDRQAQRDLNRYYESEDRQMNARFGTLALEQAQRQAQAEKDAIQQADLDRQAQDYERFKLESAFAPPIEPTRVTRTPAAPGRSATITMRPDTSAAPVSTRAVLEQQLSRLPPNHPVRMNLEKQIAAFDDAQAKRNVAEREIKVKEADQSEKARQNAPFVVPKDATGAPLSGQAVLDLLPEGKRGVVTAVLAGRQMVPTGAALKDPYWKSVIEAASAVDPSFDAVNYNARAQTRTDFSKGKAAGQINAINTVVGHLSDLAKQGDDLGNFGMNWANSIYNALTPGGTKRSVTINNFETLKEGVANELMRVWRQVGAGSEKEIEDWKKTIGATKSPEELRGAFTTIGGMLESKLGALDEQYKQGMGTTDISAISPESRKRLDALIGGRTAAAPRPAAKGGADPLGIR